MPENCSSKQNTLLSNIIVFKAAVCERGLLHFVRNYFLIWKLPFRIHKMDTRQNMLKAIHFVTSVCLIFIWWKKILFTQPFQAKYVASADISCEFYENKLLLQKCLHNECTLNQTIFFNMRTIVNTETNNTSKESWELSFLVPEVHQEISCCFSIIFITYKACPKSI